MDRMHLNIDIVKLTKYLLKYCWLILLCAAVGFGYMYLRATKNAIVTYTASGTMYIYNGNPNVVNYGYTSSSDLTSAVKLLDTYTVVIRSNKVLDVVSERLAQDYPYITPQYIAATLSMGSIAETGVVSVRCTAVDPQLATDICNTVMDVAPAEIKRVVSAGSIEIIDYATVPTEPNASSPMKQSLIGAAAGAAAAAAVLSLLFLLYRKVRDTEELTEQYTLPVLASIRRDKKDSEDPETFLLNKSSPMDQVEMYAKLRMNMMYTLVGKEKHSILVTSAISGEGKSTIAANLAVSIAMSGRKVLLVDADMRRGCQSRIFKYSKTLPGLSDVLLKSCTWKSSLVKTNLNNMDVLPAGSLPPNPTELLDSSAMRALLPKLELAYDMVVIDVPPVNIVTDAFVLSPIVAGGIFIVRQRYSDHREIHKALEQAEMSGLNLLGFVFYGEKAEQGGHYQYYKNYYSKYDTRGKTYDRLRSNRSKTPDKE
ncbi:MAG: polysaccharide biosynthesis tyrosine autokinase [Clostridia bacterium]|nr:polysaccharide biosynthesis tyrosine autokinase [Clostridia bacterium]